MLIFPLKKQWYEKIKSGEKTIEYREVKPYWKKRFYKELSKSFEKRFGQKFCNYEKFDEYSVLCDTDAKLTCKLRLGYTNEYMTANITKIEVVYGKNTDLEKENAELDCQKNRNKSCYSCANATERCFRNEIGCPCQKYKSYKEENADLERAYNETEELLAKQIEATYKVVEENKELKEKLKPENCLKLLAKEGYITFSSDKLTKAKEIIKDFLSLGIFGIFKGTTAEEIVTKAEQFLKECE